MIKSYLKTRTKYRGKGIDIRADGGYVVGPPSVVNGVPYQVSNDTKPIDMPASLLQWLLEGGATEGSPTTKQTATPTTTTTTTTAEYDFNLSPELALEILSELDGKYLTNFSDWFLVTGVLKKHGLENVWDQWSKQAGNYNQAKNQQIWLSRSPCLDINCLVYLLRTGGSKREFVEKWKPYHPITKNLSEVKQ